MSTLFLDGVSQSVRVTVWQTVGKAVEQRVSESDTQSVTKYCQRHRIWFKFRKKSCVTIQHNPKSKIQFREINIVPCISAYFGKVLLQN